jgi:hypothetical protein
VPVGRKKNVPAGGKWKICRPADFCPAHFFPPAHFFTRLSGFILPRQEFLNLDALNALKKAPMSSHDLITS